MQRRTDLPHDQALLCHQGLPPNLSLSPSHAAADDRHDAVDLLPLEALKQIQHSLATLPTRQELDGWAQRIESSLKREVEDLRAQVTHTDNRVTTIASEQATQESRITALESIVSHHRSQLLQVRLRSEDIENRSRRNNIRIRGLPEATAPGDLAVTITSIFNSYLDRAPSTEIELDRVHRVSPGVTPASGRPRDVLCRVHYYKVKDLILRKAWHRGPIDFDGASIQLLPDLSRATLGMRRAVRPLLAAIRESGATYTWGFPFHVQVKKENRQFILKSPDQLPELFLFLGSDPIPVPNWLDALLEDSAPQISNPLPQRRRRSRSSGAVSGQAHIHPSDPEL